MSARKTIAEAPAVPRLRLDKWLWAARFFRTRPLALAAIAAGRVTVNGVRPKPGRAIAVGDTVTVERPPFTWEVAVLGLADRRGPAVEAERLYRESEASVAKRRELAARQASERGAAPATPERPNKRQRRAIQRFIEELEARLDRSG
jgi:ribosome-associated heat shock protein Hsp15